MSSQKRTTKVPRTKYKERRSRIVREFLPGWVKYMPIPKNRKQRKEMSRAYREFIDEDSKLPTARRPLYEFSEKNKTGRNRN